MASSLAPSLRNAPRTQQEARSEQFRGPLLRRRHSLSSLGDRPSFGPGALWEVGVKLSSDPWAQKVAVKICHRGFDGTLLQMLV